MRIAWLLQAVLLVAGSEAVARPITLAARGRTVYVIYTARQASPTIRHAATELAQDLHQMTGAQFPQASRPKRGRTIFVGPSNALKRVAPNIDWQALPDEAFVIRTLGSNLALAGRTDRGTLYATYAFLEHDLGVRWYAPDDTVIPHRSRLRIEALRRQSVPAFNYRDTDEKAALGHAAWDAHLRFNGEDVPDRADLGGVTRFFNGAEDFYQLVPPTQYFASHPEYFSLLNGKRNANTNSQLCLTNPDVLDIVTRALVAQARQDPKLKVLGLSPNDANGNCQCAACLASDQRYGGPSGTLLHFVNQVARRVRAALPGRHLWVETLAYQYTEKPPRPGAITPADNVLVCLAPIHACVAHPLGTCAHNKLSNSYLMGWSAVAQGHLQVWHYVTDFGHYLQPMPDWAELGADFAHYRQAGVTGIFCEGDYNNANGEMEPLRTWVMAHLLWNPHQNVWALVRDFCHGYYGNAGPFIYRYLRLLQAQVKRPGVHAYVFDPPTAPYLTTAFLAQATGLFQSAEDAAGSPVLRGRVQAASLGVRTAEIERTPPTIAGDPRAKAAFERRLVRLGDDMKSAGIADPQSDNLSPARWVQYRLDLLHPEWFIHQWQLSPQALPWATMPALPPVSATDADQIVAALRTQPVSQETGVGSHAWSFDLRRHYGDVNNVVAYALRTLRAKRQQQVTVLAGADNGFRIWMDGRLIISAPWGHTHSGPDRYQAQVTLAPGTHRLLVESPQDRGSWYIAMRLADSHGRPLILDRQGWLP